MKAGAALVLFAAAAAECSRGSAPAPETAAPVDNRPEGLPEDQKRQADEDVPPL